jgi:putative acetyltransferase
MSPLTIRLAEEADQKYLSEWLLQPGVLKWFPLSDLREVEDAARIWMSYSKQSAVLTALWDGVPCGIANLYLQPYKKLAHQCLFAIIVDEKYRGKGIGRKLLEELLLMAKEKFKLEMIHLEVYAKVKETIEKAGIKCEEAELAMVAKTWVEVSDENADNNITLIEWLENIDDVDAVYHNMKV